MKLLRLALIASALGAVAAACNAARLTGSEGTKRVPVRVEAVSDTEAVYRDQTMGSGG
ncbi:MAG TPA: hypothetical protein VJT67_11085 [Longimicrobiaceae bacterium]|nr:hypothetical protein [Longimicrobiaceae bacterium]